MRRELALLTTGVVAGWMAFHPKGQQVAKDLCILALDSMGVSHDKFGEALKSAVCETDVPAIEEHKDAAHNPDCEVHENPCPHNPGEGISHAHDKETHTIETGPQHHDGTHTPAAAKEHVEIKEDGHAVP